MAIEMIDGIKLDIKPNEIRYRVISPDKFDSKSFRRKSITKGVALLVGCPAGQFERKRKKCTVGTRTQALRFDRDVFTPEKAAEWVEKHKKRLKRR